MMQYMQANARTNRNRELYRHHEIQDALARKKYKYLVAVKLEVQTYHLPVIFI